MTKSLIKLLRQVRDKRLETGFSMLEAVVVVGVLLALAVGGFVAYGTIAENAKRAAVKSAASQLHTGVVSANFDGDASTDPQKVIDEWNASTDKIYGEILSPKAGETSANGDFCVQATHKENPSIKARSGACDEVPGDAGGVVTDPTKDTDGDGLPDTSDPDIDGDGIPNASDPTPNGGTNTGSNPGSNGGVVSAVNWTAARTIINRYPDPGFKNGISGWTGTKIQREYTNDATVNVDYSVSGYNGDAGALKISATGSAGHDVATVYFPIDVDTVRDFSYQITTPDGTWDPNASWTTGLMAVDESSGNVIWSAGGAASRAGGLGANVWERIDYYNNSNPPADTPHKTYLVIQADHIPAGRTVSMLVDRMFVSGDCTITDCEAPLAETVGGLDRNFDGSYPSNTNWTFSWTGAVNNSSSKAVSPKAISAPAKANVGDTIQVKGVGYPANSTVTPSVFFRWAPGADEKDIYGTPVQTDASGNFDTTVSIPSSTALWDGKVGIVEDESWRAASDIELNAAPGTPAPTAPGPWSDIVNGSTEQISAPSVITIGQDFVVMGRGYAPYQRINVWSDNYEADGIDVYPYADKNGNFTVTIPSGAATSGPGVLNTWWNENIRLNVTFQ